MLFRRLGLVDRVVEGVEGAGLKCTVYDQEIFIAQKKFINAEWLRIVEQINSVMSEKDLLI